MIVMVVCHKMVENVCVLQQHENNDENRTSLLLVVCVVSWSAVQCLAQH